MKWIFGLLVLIFLSCAQTVEQPENLIDEQKMTEILSDVYLHQQASYLTETKNTQPDFAKIDSLLIQKHGATVKDFENSYKFYVLNPEKFNNLLLNVRDNLEQKLPKNERIKRQEDRKKAKSEKK